MPAPFSPIRTFIVSIWVEGVIYGFFMCIFSLSLAVNLGTSKRQSAHSRAMFIVGIITFVLATVHITINCMRMMRGYVDHSALPGGPVGYLGILSQWDHVFKNVIYVMQSLVGDSVAVYRCWVLWNRNYYVVCVPFFMVFGSAVSGCITCVTFANLPAGSTVFTGALNAWIITFTAIAVAQNIITTGLMAWRIAAAEQQVSSHRLSKGNLMPILRILVESAALYLFAELILLVLYVSTNNALFIALEAITPIVGITFNLITIRITLHSQSSSSTSGSGTEGTDSLHPTIGQIPLRHIAVNITNSQVTDYDMESQLQSGGEHVNEVRKISGE
ncbi:hypothetical protein DFH09DRAFT_1159953 [Mycena vulgaris]|nr:hypothetical protein DFH09DRAFT_1159953 [Mycena vulgaris]